MHHLLKRQIDRLGLGVETAPDASLWKQFVERVNASYAQSDETRHLFERSMELSSREMQELYDRERSANEQLEERVRQRTADLEGAELAARSSEARFRTTFDNAPVGIMHTDVSDDRILYTNPKLSEMLGYTRDELLNMRTDDFLQPEAVGTDRPKYREQMLKGEMAVYSSERRYIRKDSSSLWVSRTVSVARDASGKSLYLSASSRTSPSACYRRTAAEWSMP